MFSKLLCIHVVKFTDAPMLNLLDVEFTQLPSLDLGLDGRVNLAFLNGLVSQC